MNVRELRYLVALAECRHFGQAAERCYVSQPTLSQQIKKIEHVLGTELFDRSGRQLRLTAAGEAVLAHARRMLDEYEALRDAARRFREPGAGPLHFGVFPTLAPYFLPHVVAPLHARYPRLQLRLTEGKTSDLVEALDNGQLDVAALALPAPGALEAETLFEEPFLLAMHPSHALARRERVEPGDLAAQTLLLLDEGHCLRDQALEVCDRVGAEESQVFRATSLETLKHMIATDPSNMTLVPEMAVREDGLRYVPFAEPAPSRRIGLVWRRRAVHEAFYRQLAGALRALYEAARTARASSAPGAPERQRKAGRQDAPRRRAARRAASS